MSREACNTACYAGLAASVGAALAYAAGVRSVGGAGLGPILVLAGLVPGTGLLEASGALHEAARRLSASAGRLAVPLFLLGAGLLAAVTLNDAAILVAAPMAIDLADRQGASRAWMLALAAASVNIGSALGPYGNPQDALILHHYDLGLAELLRFTVPAYLPALAALAILGGLAASGAGSSGPPIAVRRLPALLGAASTAASIAAGLAGLPWIAPVAGVLALLLSRAPWAADWGAVLLVAAAYIPARIVAHTLGVSPPSGDLSTYTVAVLLSAAISNVPATSILLGSPWQPLHLGVNTASALHLYSSLANLLALKVTGVPAREFTEKTLPIGVALVLYGLAVIALSG